MKREDFIVTNIVSPRRAGGTNRNRKGDVVVAAERVSRAISTECVCVCTLANDIQLRQWNRTRNVDTKGWVATLGMKVAFFSIDTMCQMKVDCARPNPLLSTMGVSIDRLCWLQTKRLVVDCFFARRNGAKRFFQIPQEQR